jgi:hypothetical protein
MGTDRDSNGRFLPGHPGLGGRPRRAADPDYLVVLNESVSMDRWRRIVARALDEAEDGDARAREWLSGYLIGKPVAAVTVSGPEGGPLEVNAIVSAVLAALSEFPDARLAVADELRKVSYAHNDLGPGPRNGLPA